MSAVSKSKMYKLVKVTLGSEKLEKQTDGTLRFWFEMSETFVQFYVQQISDSS